MLTRRSLCLARQPGARQIASSSLKGALQAEIPAKREQVTKLRKEHGDVVLGSYTVGAAYGGMRGIKGLVTETSLLDAEEGIRFRGYSIPECRKLLPKAAGGEEPLPESLLWLLTTGKVPTGAEVAGLVTELQERAKTFPAHVEKLLAGLPRDMHPMTQLAIGINALQTESRFAAAYQAGEAKGKLWEHCYEDMLNLVSYLPRTAAHIYRNVYGDGSTVPQDKAGTLDWSANFAHMMGPRYDSDEFYELMRLYLTIHSDHEGGNVSAHTTHLVGSALSDPYLSLAAGMNGLAGPLHGLANQEVLRWTMRAKASLGDNITADSLTKYCWDTLNGGQVIPGFGHAVLRKTDPRYTCQREFALKHLPNDPLFQLVSLMLDVVPAVLTEHGKTANPWPNVDAHSGVLLQYYGLKEENYYTVLFGVSRALGVLPSMLWDRILGLPIERPKSITSDWLADFVAKQKK